MSKTISSRTPEGSPNRCPICNASIVLEPSLPTGDAPCPKCGTLLWFTLTSAGIRFYAPDVIASLRERVLLLMADNLGVRREQLAFDTPIHDLAGVDELDIIELAMEIEEAFEIVLPDAELEQFKTVGDLIDCILRQLTR